jgi:3-oxoacyl-[acyl-carrier protein] reductase
MGLLTNKVALITGGSKGIGRATAIRLARDGAKVVINYSSDGKAAEELVAKIGSDHAIAVKADAGSISGCQYIVNAAIEHFGRIDILIPNAGILPNSDIEHTSEADFDRAIALNVKGPYFLVQV